MPAQPLFARVAALTVALTLLAAAPAMATTDTATSGQVTATLTYTKYGNPDYPSYKDVRITISRAGQVVIDQAAPKAYPDCEGRYCVPAPLNASSSDKFPSVFARDVNADGEPEVWADFYTGGANCCVFSAFYDYQPATGSYRYRRVDWGSAGYTLKDLNGDGVVEFRGADIRFKYAFSCGACSPQPPQVWDFRGGKFVDVTRRFPRVIRTDAASNWHLFLHDRRKYDMRGVMAAYVADKYLLGQGKAGWRRAVAAERAGYFHRSTKRGLTSGPYDGAYLRALRRFLHRYGYVR